MIRPRKVEMYAVFQPLSASSFFSIWYWALSVSLWTLICLRTLGVPHDMLLRAGRLPEVAERVDLLAHIAAERAVGVMAIAGAPLAGLVGFALAMLAGIGFHAGVELAQALFALLFPLTLVGVAGLRLAWRVRRDGLRGEDLRGLLARRRMWNQTLAMLALLATSLLALTHHPHLVLR